MLRKISVFALTLALALPAAAQVPAGWQMRVDRSTNAADPDDVPDVKFTTMGSGFHVATGPAAVMWHPENRATGTYNLKGTFTLNQPSGHTNYYGIVFGGGDLAGAGQNYLYFVVAQNGMFQVRHRAGDEVHTVQARTEHAAVTRPDANGKSVNVLEVRVGADKIDFVVNETVVHSTPKTGMAARTDGLWGFRINHVIPSIQIDGLGIVR